MKKFTFGMVGLVALIALGGQAKAYAKAKELKKESVKTFKKFEACQAKTKVLQPCSNTNPLFKKCEE